MRGRVCLVTGATSGIGEATARALAGMGATVLIHGRDGGRCEHVARTIADATGNENVGFVVADFASFAAVRDMAAELHRRTDRLHVLVNNAGAMYPARRESPDGIELTLAVDHLAPFLLTNLVLDLLAADPPSRVVNVSSGAHRRAELHFDDLESHRDYEGRRVYARVKAMNILFTRELARRAPPGVTVNAISPGLVHTEFGLKDGYGPDQQEIMNRGATPDMGARTSIYVATAPDLEGVTGQYFQDAAPAETGPVARDDEAARRLWEVSARLVGLPPR
jgi:NAD(P)-dependent dehydrogenase (short-subunit alcohol dehydrogenase family)